MDFSIIIPARLGSSRLRAKLLQDIGGKPLIQHTFENAGKSAAKRIVIATDDEKIATCAKNFGAEICMTGKHPSGTSRIGEAVTILGFENDETIVNIQGDEPMLPAAVINQAAQNLSKSMMTVATLCANITDENDYSDPNCVKVVFAKNGRALYFSRAPIPYFFAAAPDFSRCYRHIGIYAFRAEFAKHYASLEPSAYERAERLEQLRILDAGFDIHVAVAAAAVGVGVDTEADLAKVRRMLADGGH